MKVQDRLTLVLTLSMLIILIVIVIGVIILALYGKEVPPILEDLGKIIGGTFAGYVGGLASAYSSMEG